MTGIGTQIKNALGWFKTNLVNNWLIKSCVADVSDQSTVENKALSAWQGKLLQDQINSLNTNLNTILIANVLDFHFHPVWQVLNFECIKSNSLIILNVGLFCNGQINANTNYTMTSEPVDNKFIPRSPIRIIGNACDSDFGNTVCANIYFDNQYYLKVNVPNEKCRYISFSAVYRAL